MNKRLVYLLLTALSLCFFACEQEKTSISPAQEALNQKQLPFDLSSFQRAYPDKAFDVRAYKSAFEKAIEKNEASRSTAPEGFDDAWTVQGPGSAGARINVIEIDPNDDDVLYLGYSGGGVFKSTDDGLNWAPIFDDQPYLSIGAIEVDPNNSDVVFVGTGDPNITGYPYIGNGVYKSSDAGTTWVPSGLANVGIVSKIIVDPTNSQIIYAAAMGNPFWYDDNRGLYKSTDGGASWTKVLFISNQAGVIDIAVNPNSPDVIYAAGWDRLRTPVGAIVHGNGGRIYRSENGGSSWEVLDNGLPQKELSRSSIAMSETDPNVLYVSIVDSTYFLQGVYKTTNGGDSWTTVTSGGNGGIGNALSNFGWYFGRIFINPSDDDEIYLLGIRLWGSSNGGDFWSIATPTSGSNSPHVDNHYMAFNSQGDLYLATDGGMYKNPVNTQSWIDREDIPATQIYRVGYNPHEPDTYYGGAQDNGTQAGNASGIDNWDLVFGADGFQPVFHPTDPNTYYYESQSGNIAKTEDGIGFFSFTQGLPAANVERRNWDMQYIMSAHDYERFYTGTYRIYRRDSIENIWYTISDDLTDGNIYGSVYHSISTVHESPENADILYAGTTDGNVWRSMDFGNSWEEVTGTLPDRYVTSIKADPNDENGVYVSHSGYRYNDYIPHVHYSSDNGITWTDISGDLPPVGVNHIEVMPNNFGNVIFAATDAGVYATLDGGNNWDRLGTEYPYVTTYDLDLNIAKNELIAGTFGRSILTFPLDSIGVSLNPPAIANIAGNISTAAGEGLDTVSVFLEASGQTVKLTDVNGNYDFSGVLTGQTVEVSPYKNTKHGNGTSSFDLVIMKRHILNVDTMMPYDIIAGDVNNNGSVSSFDLVLLTKVILNIDTVFSSNTSWRFVRADHVFSDPLDPFPFPETIDYAPFGANQSNADFVAVKIGDVNSSANPGMLMGEADSRTFDGLFELSMKDHVFQKGEKIRVPVNAKEFNELLGYQFTLEFDPTYLSLQSVDKADLATTGSQDFGETFVEKGILTTNWTNALPVSLEPEATLFYLNFEAKKNGSLKDLIKINNEYTTKEAYQGLTTLLDVSLDWKGEESDENSLTVDQIYLHQNVPNPVRKDGLTRVKIDFPMATKGRFELFSISGKMLWSTEQHFAKGRQELELTGDLFPDAGIYFYRFSTEEGNAETKRLLYLD